MEHHDSTITEKLLSDESAEPLVLLEQQQQQPSSALGELSNAGDIIVDPGQATLRGQPQVPDYRDTPYAAAFLLHLLVMLGLSLSWGLQVMTQHAADTATEKDDDDGYNTSDGEDTYQVRGTLGLLFLTTLASLGISAGTFSILSQHAALAIQYSLAASMTLLGLLTVLSFMMGMVGVGCLLLLSCAFSGLYAYFVWHRIPFAAANVRAAWDAISTNYGVIGVAYGIAGLQVLFGLIWGMALLGVLYHSHQNFECDSYGGSCHITHVSAFGMIFMLLSYYWTTEVLKNILHVTVAGIVGTWWFAPQDASSPFSPAIQQSLKRASTYSLGSICMGSLLVAVIQTLQAIAHQARRHANNDRNTAASLLLCLVECLLSFLQDLVDYFNQYAYVYIGLYGYDYLTAGRNVIGLFRQRGWTAIINDQLVYRVLTLIGLVIGCLTGLFGVLLNKATGWADASVGADAHGTVFLLSSVLGWSLAMVVMGVVQSAVDTIIVSLAEAPQEFQMHHPALSQQVMTAWRQVYPNECNV